jgi:dTDP-4-dehydrorhamnose 3,5-epimerase
VTFTETPLRGAFLIDLERREDERGYFARLWCEQELQRHGLVSRFVQCNTSFSRKCGTIRGLHYQVAPHAEVKLMSCVQGAVYDVIVDLRPDSRTFRRWFGVELTAESGRMLYVPEGFAHGFQTLCDDSRVSYPVSAAYCPAAERGVRWDDPAFGIAWPETRQRHISPKDRSWPDHRDSITPCASF